MKKETASLYCTVALYLTLSTICVTANKLYPKISDVEDVIAREDDVAVEDKLYPKSVNKFYLKRSAAEIFPDMVHKEGDGICEIG